MTRELALKLRAVLLASLAGWTSCSQELLNAEPAPDLARSACVPDSDCELVEHPCHIGLLQCTAPPTCLDSGAGRLDGTQCGKELSCRNGACVGLCDEGARCMPRDRCHQGLISCASGTAQCADTGRPADDQPSCGLLGYWPFDGDGVDRSDGLRPLLLRGAPGFAPGVLGLALDLHGNGDQYAIRPASDADFNFGARDFSIQVWVHYNQTGGEQLAVEKFRGGGGPGWTLTKLNGDGLHFYSDPSATLTSAPVSISIDKWHHYLVRRKGLVFDLFYDGIKKASQINANPIPASTQPLLVGRRNSLAASVLPMDGQIDELAIWGRSLSDSEVVALYNDGRALALY